MVVHREAWTSERVEQLKSCFNAGLSCSQIAGEIGATRNAVIGKLNRLGLTRSREAIASARERSAATKASRPKAPRAESWRSRQVLLRLFAGEQRILTPAGGPSGDAAIVPIHEGRGCSLLELDRRACRWPINEPGAEDFCYCGNASIEGLSYCLGHARLAYRAAGRPRAAVR